MADSQPLFEIVSSVPNDEAWTHFWDVFWLYDDCLDDYNDPPVSTESDGSLSFCLSFDKLFKGNFVIGLLVFPGSFADSNVPFQLKDFDSYRNLFTWYRVRSVKDIYSKSSLHIGFGACITVSSIVQDWPPVIRCDLFNYFPLPDTEEIDFFAYYHNRSQLSELHSERYCSFRMLGARYSFPNCYIGYESFFSKYIFTPDMSFLPLTLLNSFDHVHKLDNRMRHSHNLFLKLVKSLFSSREIHFPVYDHVCQFLGYHCLSYSVELVNNSPVHSIQL